MPTSAEQREHDATARALLAVEEATLSVLLASLGDLGRSPAGAAEELRRRLLGVYLGARRAARTQSRARLRAELAVVLEEVAAYGFSDPSLPLPDLPRADAEDESAANLWAGGISDALRRRAEVDGVRRAVTATRRRIELSAQAVTADAWADERERVLDTVVREERDTRWLPFVGRLWDARLDACPVCRRLDGTIRPIGIEFPNGYAAGRTHWLCRCTNPLVATPIYLGREESDAA